MPLKKQSKIDAHSSIPFSRSSSSLSECFRSPRERMQFNTYFASRLVNTSIPLDLGALKTMNFYHLQILRDWQWIDFFKNCSTTFKNLVQVFYSNSKLEHDDSDKSIISINSYLMNTLICLTLEDFKNLLSLPSGGVSNEKGPFSPVLYVKPHLVANLDIHDRLLHFIITWVLRPTSKHVVIWSIDYWWIDCFKSNRPPDLTLLMFNNITKVIGKELGSSLTLPFGTYLSYIFTRLHIKARGDPPVKKHQPIDFGGNPNEVPSPKKVPPPASSSALPQAPSFYADTLAIFDAIRLVQEEFRGLDSRVSRLKDNMGSRLSSLEDQLAQLVANFPPLPPHPQKD
ncbi:hypothetical protein Gogos_020567 [Gossypium gossypioides]|uniref:Uncharacterized protein n=1 Tax=Gossypium gossypioides TaxID=34282 RepID=A0A7J9CYH8_GOSGO|nr:hypothetical protein [Gossypium gossypioides]